MTQTCKVICLQSDLFLCTEVKGFLPYRSISMATVGLSSFYFPRFKPNFPQKLDASAYVHFLPSTKNTHFPPIKQLYSAHTQNILASPSQFPSPFYLTLPFSLTLLPQSLKPFLFLLNRSMYRRCIDLFTCVILFSFLPGFS